MRSCLLTWPRGVAPPGGQSPPGEGGAGQVGHAGAARPAALPGEIHLRGVCGRDGQLRGGHQPAAGPPGLEPGEGSRRGRGRASGEAAGQLTAAAASPPTAGLLLLPVIQTGGGAEAPPTFPNRETNSFNVPERRRKRFHDAERLI